MNLDPKVADDEQKMQLFLSLRMRFPSALTCGGVIQRRPESALSIVSRLPPCHLGFSSALLLSEEPE